jgi:hypothetical protein
MALWLGWSYLSLHMASDNRRGQIKSGLRFKNGKHPSPSRRVCRQGNELKPGQSALLEANTWLLQSGERST